MANRSSTALSNEQLKNMVRPIILSQGNKYIKELLRKNKIPIGSTKADFSQNLMDAIDNGSLTQDIIELWLDDVEGWGDQHIYIYEPPQLTYQSALSLIQASSYASVIAHPVGLGSAAAR